MFGLSALEFALLCLTVQFAGVAGGILFAFLRRGRAQVQAQAEAVTGLVSKVEATADARRAALSAIIAETYRFDDGETERVVTDFIERERAFYNAMIGVHLGRGGKTLADVPGELTKVVAPWLRLTPKGMISADAVEALENANSILNQELASTKRVLDELMEEYNAAFHKEREQAAQAAQAATGESVHEQDLMSIDDDVTPSPPGPGAASGAAASEDPGGEIIALDLDVGDDAPPAAVDGLTPNDLDALMENLDADYAPKSAAA